MGDTADTPDLMDMTPEQLADFERMVAANNQRNFETISNMTPEEQARFNQMTYAVASQEPISGQYTGPNVTDGDNQNTKMGALESSLTTPYGTNDGTYIPVARYTGFINPHGGQTFFGIKPNGQKEIITREEAMALGYTPADTSTGDFYDQADWNANLTSGEDQRQNSNDNFEYEIPGTDITLPPGPLPTEPWTPSPGDDNPGSWVPPTYGGGGGSFTPTGEGAVSGPAPIDWGTQAPQSDLIGYESSTNKDFYQQQFANMRDQAAQDRMRQDAASAYQAPARENVMDDPWGWANLPDVVTAGQYPEGQSANDWLLNEGYSPQTTDAQVISRLGGLSVFNDEDRRWLSDVVAENPNLNQSQLFTSGRQAALDRIGTMDLDAGNKARYNTLINNLYTQRGDAPTAGGMSVPIGYASPTNA